MKTYLVALAFGLAIMSATHVAAVNDGYADVAVSDFFEICGNATSYDDFVARAGVAGWSSSEAASDQDLARYRRGVGASNALTNQMNKVWLRKTLSATAYYLEADFGSSSDPQDDDELACRMYVFHGSGIIQSGSMSALLSNLSPTYQSASDQSSFARWNLKSDKNGDATGLVFATSSGNSVSFFDRFGTFVSSIGVFRPRETPLRLLIEDKLRETRQP